MQSKIKLSIIILALLAIAGCSNSNSTGPDNQLFVEYDDGLNMTVELKHPGPAGVGTAQCITIAITLPVTTSWRVDILNCTGYQVKSYSGFSEAGEISIDWDLTNEQGIEVKSGLYIYEAYAAGLGARRAMIVER